ncbi:hypothetical protein [Bacillus sp. UNC41MFS5]|uniref:hypothetical protein n=1 Tax=Bacillus sp. UNC41MFS5 TaxID=1449046 RepID=UPI00047E2AAD|nr:hypothetical protein [Bacillus sp. UNC41MFS5]
MAKSKNKSCGPPTRNRYNRNARLQNAKKWAEQYNGKNIAKGYSKWFGVDLLCAIKELEILGYKFKQSYKEQVNQSLIERQKQNGSNKREKEMEKLYDNGFGSFYFISDYTSNGFQDGISLAEIEGQEDQGRNLTGQGNILHFISDEDLPF